MMAKMNDPPSNFFGDATIGYRILGGLMIHLPYLLCSLPRVPVLTCFDRCHPMPCHAHQLGIESDRRCEQNCEDSITVGKRCPKPQTPTPMQLRGDADCSRRTSRGYQRISHIPQIHTTPVDSCVHVCSCFVKVVR